jgi:hypothetical protein
MQNAAPVSPDKRQVSKKESAEKKPTVSITEITIQAQKPETTATDIGLFFIAIGTVKANWKPGDSYGYCKSGQGVKNVKSCKENGGKW